MNIQICSRLAFCCAALVLSTTASAGCPMNMPEQLRQDCIVVEGTGASFPNPTYAYKAEYEQWIIDQAVQTQPAAGGMAVKDTSGMQESLQDLPE